MVLPLLSTYLHRYLYWFVLCFNIISYLGYYYVSYFIASPKLKHRIKTVFSSAFLAEFFLFLSCHFCSVFWKAFPDKIKILLNFGLPRQGKLYFIDYNFFMHLSKKAWVTKEWKCRKSINDNAYCYESNLFYVLQNAWKNFYLLGWPSP